VGQIAQALRAAFAGVDAGNWVDPTGETRYVRVRLPPKLRESPSDIAKMPVVLPGGTGGPAVVPLGQVASITSSTGPAQIDHLDLCCRQYRSRNGAFHGRHLKRHVPEHYDGD